MRELIDGVSAEFLAVDALTFLTTCLLRPRISIQKATSTWGPRSMGDPPTQKKELHIAVSERDRKDLDSSLHSSASLNQFFRNGTLPESLTT
jgi:hypothetical protein